MADDARSVLEPPEEEDDVWIDPGPDEQDIARRDAEAEADIAAGRLISNEAVMRWIASWGTKNPLPRPRPGD